jgi:Fe-S-cluster containining protein
MYYTKFCKTCKKEIHCCIFKNNSGFTFVGIKDAKRIKDKIKKDYNDFLDYSPLPGKLIKELKNDDPALEGALRYSQLNNKRLLRLKTKKEGRCIFLDDSGKCEIYKIRPNICKIFPFWAMRLENNNLKAIEHDVYPKCPIVKETLPDNQKIKKIFRDIEKENSYYKKYITSFTKNLKQP